MSLATDLRLTASAVEAQGEALERLVFCTRAYFKVREEREPSEILQTKLDQLWEALKFAQKFT